MKNKNTKKAIFIISMAVILISISGHIFLSPTKQAIQLNDRQTNARNDANTQKLISEVEKLIINKMEQGKIPGLSVAVVKDGETAYKAGFGYANIKTGEKVTSDTLFQLASNSKAFTSLGVLQLQKDRQIDLDDPISKYISWLKLYYCGKETDVTIAEFLHHTSGISSNTIYRIPELNEENHDAIEKTVRTIVGIDLVSESGTKYEYATINYDILGLLIEKASGMKYEDYIQRHVLDAAGLSNTYMFKSKADETKLASGYKLGFLAPQCYNAPWYEGNKPAGYILSNANDMAEWLKIQMGTKSSSLDTKIIAQSQSPDLSVNSLGEDMAYAAGWIVHNNAGKEIFHSGTNPNFSSFIIFRPDEKTGVAVLCNIKTTYAMDIAQSIIKLFSNSQSRYTSVADFNQLIDRVCTAIIFILLFAICLTLFSLIRSMYPFVTKKQRLHSLSKKAVIEISVTASIFVMISCIVYFLPKFLLGGATWGYLIVWYPITVKPVLCLTYISLFLLLCNIIIKIFRSNISSLLLYSHTKLY
jgi:putative ATP-binding cassette transporter